MNNSFKKMTYNYLSNLKYYLKKKSNSSAIEFEIKSIKRKIGENPRKIPGNVKVLDWDIDYVDNLALLSSLEILVQKGWNDFLPDNNDPFILDCGANIGISILNYKRKYPNSRIIAFEPDPTIIPVLKRNMLANKISDVTIVEAAVWKESGELSFIIEGADGSRLISDNQKGSINVKTIDLADYLNDQIDLIKMDIESAEMAVIPHIKNKLTLVRNMVIECHVNGNEVGKLGSLLKVLSDNYFYISINSIGPWRDLIIKPDKLPLEFDQYFIVTATRNI